MANCQELNEFFNAAVLLLLMMNDVLYMTCGWQL